MSRDNQILTGILVVQLVLIAFSFWPRPVETVGRALLFPGADMDSIVRITVNDLVDGQIQLSKVAGDWVLPNADDYPCEGDTVASLLETLVSLEGDRLVTETKSSHRRLQVAEDSYVRLIELAQEDDILYTLYVGSSPSYGATHVRVKGQDRVYLVSGLSSADLSVQVTHWIDTAYLTLQQDQVVSISLENSHGQFGFVRENGQADWVMTGLAEDERLNQSALSSLLRQVSFVQMVRPLSQEKQPAYGLDEPSVVLVMQTRDEDGEMNEYRLDVGVHEQEASTYVAKSSESPYYVEIAAYVAEAWIEQTKETFLELPPTLTPETQ